MIQLNHNSNPFAHTKVLKQIERKDQFYQAIHKRKRKGLFARLINFVVLHLVIKRFVVRNPLRFNEVLQRWKEDE